MAVAMSRSFRCITLASRSRACAVVKAGAFFQLDAHTHEKVVRQKRLRHMSMPAVPGTGFVMVQPDFALAFLEGRFNRPAPSTATHQFTVGIVRRRITHIDFQLPFWPQAAAEDHPDARPAEPVAHERHTLECKLRDKGTLAAFFDRVAFPGAGRQVHRQAPCFLRLGCGLRNPRPTALAGAGRFDRRRTSPTAGRDGHFGQIVLLQRRNAVHRVPAVRDGGKAASRPNRSSAVTQRKGTASRSVNP